VNSRSHQSTRALATFAASLDPARLPDEVRRKLGWLLLDHLRVCSIGARLPWSGWARDYAGVVAKAGASHVLFSPDTLNPQHATFLNVTFGSSFDADDTHVGAMLHPGIAAWSAALATAEHVGDDVASMHLGIPKVIQGRLTNPHPVDLQAAQMCLPFSVALASHVPLAAGRIPTLAFADYEAGLGDRRLFEIENRTTIALDDEVEAASNALSTAAKVSVRLRDGRELAKFVPAPKGSAGDPFTGEEHEARFVEELSSRVSDKVCADIIAVSKELDRLDPRWLGHVLSVPRTKPTEACTHKS
jgi:2-methylcitrate dehydratase PrpD